MTTFNNVLQSHTRDWQREEFYRQQNEARQLAERVARATHWLGLRVSGRTFDNITELREVCTDLVTEKAGGIDDGLAAVLNKAVTNLWMGRVEWALFQEPRVKAQVTEEPHAVSFVTAA